ncbi:hydrogenase formation protein HypD [Candidatus Bathyarchaeota archaeon]|nr:hydrogenase formation protein HypD [Candidatus Bathyarchaeota archaeon]
MFRLRNKETADRIIRQLKNMNLNIQLMHVCGTHQDTLIRYGLDTRFRECGVNIRQGPGCPVCVTTAMEYEAAILLARRGVIITTFGDASRVPGLDNSLLGLRAEGHDVRIVYGIDDAVKIAEKTEKPVVFLGVGFETTAPSTAILILKGLPENFSILSCHRYVPPALNALLGMGEVKLQGLIEPGHVSTIIGVKPYEQISTQYHIPQVIAGFEPLDMLMAVYMLALQIKKGEARVENEYSRAVHYEGNVRALKALDEVFEPFDVDWRGFPVIRGSGMKIRDKYERLDARKVHEDCLREISHKAFEEPYGCRCGEVLRGITDSKDCPHFGTSCLPTRPIGPCMVSVEGSCNIEYRYKKVHV